MTMKVYIVVEEDENECYNHSVHSTYEGALAVVEELAEYAGLEKQNDQNWYSEDESIAVFIEIHEVE
jgi:hypothetical protein